MNRRSFLSSAPLAGLAVPVRADGATAPHARLHVYTAGTSTPAATYADAGLGTVQPWPLQADAEGRFPDTFLPPGKLYRVQVTTAEGLPLGEADQVRHAGDRLEVPRVASLLGDRALAYTGPGLRVAPGDILRTREEGIAYRVKAPGESAHMQTAGGPGGPVRLDVLPDANGIFPARAFGVTGDGVSDDAPALQAALDAAAARWGEVRLGPGTFRYGSELVIRRAVTLRGIGIRGTVFQPLEGYSGWFLRLHETNFIGTRNEGPVVALERDTAGVQLADFSVRSSRGLGHGPQHGIRCVGRNDRMIWRNVYVECLEGTHFHFGHENGRMADGTTPSPAFIRESSFYDLESRGGGNLGTGADAVVIDSHGIGDASNLSNFFNLKVVYPYRNGLRMVNHSTTNAIRRLNFYNLLVHGPGRTGVPSAAPLVVLHGAIFWCNFFGLQLNSTNPGQTGLETDSFGGQAPKGLRFLADISSGDGDSFDFRAGGQFLLSSAAFGARGTDVTLGPGVNDTVAIESLGTAPELSVHSGSARHLRHLTGSGEARPLVVGALAPGDGRSGPRLLQGEEDPRDGLEAPEGSLYLRRAGREGGARTGDRAFLNRGSDTTPAWAPVAVALGGPAEERPADPVPYQSYVDTTLGKTIWWHGEGWRDADGNPA